MEFSKHSWKVVYDVVALAALLGAVGFLAISYLKPKTSSALTPAAQAAVANVATLPGSVLSPLEVIGEDHRSRFFDGRMGAKPSVILIFKSTCAVCEASSEEWARLSTTVSAGVSVIAVNTEDVAIGRAWVQRKGIRADSVFVPARLTDLPGSWKISGVPVTLAIDSSGRVAYARIGLMRKSDVEDIRQLLNSGD